MGRDFPSTHTTTFRSRPQKPRPFMNMHEAGTIEECYFGHYKISKLSKARALQKGTNSRRAMLIIMHAMMSGTAPVIQTTVEVVVAVSVC